MWPMRWAMPGWVLAVGLFCALVASARPAPATLPATAAAGSNQFLRFVDEGPAGGSLASGEVTLTNDDGVMVHLIAAVHIAETSYYQQLNEHFRAFDAVLYEMVMPRGMQPPAPGAGGDSSVARLQRFLKDVLELDYQLDVIDYRPANFIHADLDTATFESLQRQRGESFATLMLQSLMRALADSGVAVLMISSDMEEVIGVSDRIAVMHEGGISGMLERDQFSEENVLLLAVGKPVGSGRNLQ